MLFFHVKQFDLFPSHITKDVYKNEYEGSYALTGKQFEKSGLVIILEF